MVVMITPIMISNIGSNLDRSDSEGRRLMLSSQAGVHTSSLQP